MKDIGKMRAFLADMFHIRYDATIAVDIRDIDRLIRDIEEMQSALINLKVLAYQNRDSARGGK